MTIKLDSEIVTLVGIDMDNFNIKLSYIDSTGSLKIKNKMVGWERELVIASEVIL